MVTKPTLDVSCLLWMVCAGKFNETKRDVEEPLTLFFALRCINTDSGHPVIHLTDESTGAAWSSGPAVQPTPHNRTGVAHWGLTVQGRPLIGTRYVSDDTSPGPSAMACTLSKGDGAAAALEALGLAHPPI